MPGISIHLAAANKHLETHKIKDKDAFILGSISPDLEDDGKNRHHPSPGFRDSVISYLKGKVNLKECLPDFDINTDFGKGYFLHLVMDYEFSRALLKNGDKYRDLSYREFKDLLYHDYTVTNKHFMDKYNVVFPESMKEFSASEDGTPAILDLEEIDKIIEWLGALDLDEYLSDYLSSEC